MQDYLDIIKRNLLSPIVLAIFLLAGALIYVREYRDAWFISVVIVVNSLIGIVQEIRAKRVLYRLELMSAPRARVLRDGQAVEVPYDSLVVGDEIILKAGDECHPAAPGIRLRLQRRRQRPAPQNNTRKSSCNLIAQTILVPACITRPAARPMPLYSCSCTAVLVQSMILPLSCRACRNTSALSPSTRSGMDTRPWAKPHSATH